LGTYFLIFAQESGRISTVSRKSAMDNTILQP